MSRVLILILLLGALFDARPGYGASVDRVVRISVSYEMLKGLPVEVRCLERVVKVFPENEILDEPWKRIMQSVKVGSADLTPCVFKNREREEFLEFYGPISQLPIVMVSLKDKSYSLQDIASLKGAFHRGTSLIKKFTTPDMNIQEISDINSIFNLIRNGRADYSIMPGNFLATRDTKDLSVTVVDGTPVYVGVSKLSPRKDYILDMLAKHVEVAKTIVLQENKPKLIWALTNFPPYFVLNGPLAGKGISDEAIEFYMKKLPDFQHHKLQVSLARAQAMMEKGEHLCHAALLRTPAREKYIDFSEPNMAVLPNGLIMSEIGAAKIQKYMVDETTLDLEKLLRSDSVILRYHSKRSYSPLIDKLLKQYAPLSENLRMETGKKDMKRQLSLLLSGHLDGVFGRAEEAAFLAQDLENGQSLKFLNIAGDKSFLLGQIGCAKGDWNKDLMQKINEITLKYRGSEEFARFYQNWLPENSQIYYRQVQKKAFADTP